ncbi:MAG: VanZ family protein [Lachnospiraceae bacterium]|nr:VanZ family protein [Lachnospiraceae bacterium]
MRDMKSDTSGTKKAFGFIVVFVCALFMFIFVYGLIRVSLQDGESSSRITQAVILKIGNAVFDEELTSEQVNALNLFLRCLAHFVLFFMLSFGLCIVACLIFTKPVGRTAGVLFAAIISIALAYFTEYFKQYVAGRHFQTDDAWLNLVGVVMGICFFVVARVVFWAIDMRGASKG